MDDFIKVPSEIRENLKKEFLNKGINWLQDELKNMIQFILKQLI